MSFHLVELPASKQETTPTIHQLDIYRIQLLSFPLWDFHRTATMLSRANSRAIRGLLRTLRTSPTTTTTTTATPASAPIFTSHARLLNSSAQPSNAIRARQYHSTPLNNKGLRPESSEPPAPSPEQPNNVAGGSTHLLEATPISDDLYREYAEEYFNVLQSELEELQETGSDVEAECSVCFSFPDFGCDCKQSSGWIK